MDEKILETKMVGEEGGGHIVSFGVNTVTDIVWIHLYMDWYNAVKEAA